MLFPGRDEIDYIGKGHTVKGHYSEEQSSSARKRKEVK